MRLRSCACHAIAIMRLQAREICRALWALLTLTSGFRRMEVQCPSKISFFDSMSALRAQGARVVHSGLLFLGGKAASQRRRVESAGRLP